MNQQAFRFSVRNLLLAVFWLAVGSYCARAIYLALANQMNPMRFAPFWFGLVTSSFAALCALRGRMHTGIRFGLWHSLLSILILSIVLLLALLFLPTVRTAP
jgi:hypothetical protein